MFEKLMRYVRKVCGANRPTFTLEYHHEIINLGDARVHFVHVDGMLHIHADDGDVLKFSNSINTEVLIASRRLKLPARYYYTDTWHLDKLYYTQYDFRLKPIGAVGC